MKYLEKKFNVGGYSKQYAENYERIFGMKPLLSKCCRVTINTGLTEEGDFFYVCSKCLRKCAIDKGYIKRRSFGVNKPHEGEF